MKKKIFLIIKIIALLIITVAIIQIIRISMAKNKSEGSFQQLKNVYTPSVNATENTEKKSTDNESSADNTRLLSLQDINPDCIGWLTIDGTNIDYPVMYNTDDPDYYLEHDFYGDYDLHGVPYIDNHASPDSDNITIYGHSMRDGTMFSNLMYFTDQTFCEEKHEIIFDSLNGPEKYQAVSVFKISEKDTDNFPYHTITDFSYNGITAADYVSRSKYYSIWYDDTDILKTDNLITLSTCEYTLENGRLVVIARYIGKAD